MILRRGGKWGVKAYDPTLKRSKWIGTYEFKHEAEAAEAAAKGGYLPSGRAKTVQDWSVIWLRDYQRPAPATQRTYKYAVEAIVADIGDMRLDLLDRPSARKFANKWPHGTTRVARAMFGDAMRDGLVVANPFSDLRIAAPRGRKDIDALTEKEIRSLADKAGEELGRFGREFRAIILFLGYVGCRPGELACIRRDDVDPVKGEVVIRFALDGMGAEKAPKNGKPRIVTVPPPALEALRDVPLRIGSPYLFHTPTGKRLSKGILSYYFREARAHWGRKDLEMYALRHACATLLLERGLPPHVVANQLGHTDGGALVQKLYGHPQEKGMREQVRLAFADSTPWERGMADVARRDSA
jgi:integrase